MGAVRANEDTDEKRALGEALQRARTATHARVYRGGETSVVALPGGKNRRAASVALLDRVGWDRVELVDKAGAVVDVVGAVDQPEDRAERVERVELIAPESAEDRRLAAFVELLDRAVDRALSRRESEFKAILSGVSGVVAAQSHAMAGVVGAMDALAAAYRQAGDAREESARQLAEAAASDSDPLKAIAELAPHVPALLQAVRAMSAGGGKS